MFDTETKESYSASVLLMSSGDLKNDFGSFRVRCRKIGRTNGSKAGTYTIVVRINETEFFNSTQKNTTVKALVI